MISFAQLRERVKNIKNLNKVLIMGTTALILILGISVIWFSAKDIGTEATAQELKQFSQNIRRYYQNRPDFWGLNTQTAVEKQIAPQSMIKPNGLLNAYGTAVVVGNGNDGVMLMPGARTFDIAYKGLNKQQCKELLTYKFDESFWMGLASIMVTTDKQQQSFSWNDSQNKLPVSPAKAKEICNGNTIILWHFE